MHKNVFLEILYIIKKNCILLLIDISEFWQVLESTDHVNSCKPISRTDPSYSETLLFLNKLRAAYGEDR